MLYKTLLYHRSPLFTLADTSPEDPLSVKSKLLEDFETLSKFMGSKGKRKLRELINEKLASESGIEEIAPYMMYNTGFSQLLGHFLKKNEKQSKICEDFVADPYFSYSSKSHPSQLSKFKDILIYIFEQFKDQEETIKEYCFQSLYDYIITNDVYYSKKSSLLSFVEKLYSDNYYQGEDTISKPLGEVKEDVKELALFYPSLSSLANRIDQVDEEKFHKVFRNKVVKDEIKKRNRGGTRN